MRRLIAGGMLWALLSCVVAVGPARADDDSYLGQFGWGMAAIGANLLYMPVKLAYAAVGGVTGGVVYLVTVGNGHAAEAVFGPSLGGTYVLDPAMLRGDEAIYFFGEGTD